MTSVNRIHLLPDDIEDLADPSQAEGFNFIRRLIDDFASGENRFDHRGEALFEAREDGLLLAIGGLNEYQHAGSTRIGRIRRLYVHPRVRGKGVGKHLMFEIEQIAAESFDTLCLFTDNLGASHFYERLGYKKKSDTKKISHLKSIGPKFDHHN